MIAMRGADGKITKEMIEDLRNSNYSSMPPVFFTDPADMRELCELALKGLQQEKSLEDFMAFQFERGFINEQQFKDSNRIIRLFL